ncbi:MAG: HD domain-containing protein [Phycisphaerae bacterium]|nr:HD domain-containing protein [Phycisphaerae bacterium]
MGSDARVFSPHLQEKLVARWVARRLCTLRHERRVRSLADELFRLLRPRHGLRAFDQQILRLAALLHDVGRTVNDRRHPQIGCEMILIDRVMPLSPLERRCLAYLTRFHRGAVPEIGYDGILLASDPRRAMRRVLAILRAADALDGRQHAPPQIRMKLRGSKLKLRCYLSSDCRRARKFFSRRKKFRLLEELLHVKVDLGVRDVLEAEPRR